MGESLVDCVRIGAGNGDEEPEDEMRARQTDQKAVCLLCCAARSRISTFGLAGEQLHISDQAYHLWRVSVWAQIAAHDRPHHAGEVPGERAEMMTYTYGYSSDSSSFDINDEMLVMCLVCSRIMTIRVTCPNYLIGDGLRCICGTVIGESRQMIPGERVEVGG